MSRALQPSGPQRPQMERDDLQEYLSYNVPAAYHSNGNVLVYQHEGAKFTISKPDGVGGTKHVVVNHGSESVKLDRSKSFVFFFFSICNDC